MTNSSKSFNLFAWLVVMLASLLTLASVCGYFKLRADGSRRVERRIGAALKKADKLLEEIRRNTQAEGAS